MKIAVTSPSFCKSELLRKEVVSISDNVRFNLDGTKFNEQTLIEFIGDADAAIVGLDEVTEAVLKACNQLKIVSKYGVGLDNIDVAACNKLGIKVGWTGGVNRLSVAEMFLGNALSLCRNLYKTSNQLKTGVWNKDGGMQLSGKTVGIIGFGHIGKEAARLLKPFECRILVNDIIDESDYCAVNGFEFVSKEVIYKEADVITVHTPKTNETTGLINAQTIAQMKDGVILMNTARGGIIHEGDLIAALKSGKVGGASLDVYDCEPPTNQELLGFPNLISTPHIGGNSIEAVIAMGMSAVSHIRAFKNE